jgi:branched-chain amino acid transport system permease protein
MTDAVDAKRGGSGIDAVALAGPAIVVIAAVAGAFPAVLGDYGLQIGFRLLLYISLAEAWNLLAGYCGLASLGSAFFIGLGAYVLVGMLNGLGMPVFAGLVVAGLAGALAAFIVSPALFRLRGLYFTVGTLALGEALRLFMVNVQWFGGATGLILQIDWPSTQALYFWALGLLALTELVVTIFTQSRLSVLLRAVRDDEDAASQVGVRVFWVKLAVFAIASLLMSVGGGLQAYKLAAIEPYGIFGLQWSIDILAMVVIGGLGLRLGPLVGAIFIVALGELLADYPELHIAITGLILIGVIRYAPNGIAGLGQRLARAFAGRTIAERRQ